jgi:hypothetical protein
MYFDVFTYSKEKKKATLLEKDKELKDLPELMREKR